MLVCGPYSCGVLNFNGRFSALAFSRMSAATDTQVRRRSWTCARIYLAITNTTHMYIHIVALLWRTELGSPSRRGFWNSFSNFKGNTNLRSCPCVSFLVRSPHKNNLLIAKYRNVCARPVHSGWNVVQALFPLSIASIQRISTALVERLPRTE
jgi:hypothetical protein